MSIPANSKASNLELVYLTMDQEHEEAETQDSLKVTKTSGRTNPKTPPSQKSGDLFTDPEITQ